MSKNKSLLQRLFWWWPSGTVPEISATELSNLLAGDKTKPQILDVRTSKEFHAGHIRGAINIPITDLNSKLKELDFDLTKPVVAICLSAHRSVPAVRLLKQAGYNNSLQLEGGMKAWRASSLDETV